MTKSETKPAKKIEDGISKGLPGLMFEIQMCIYLFVYAEINKLDEFQMRFQVDDAKKFDDIVFQKSKDENLFFQLKHCDKDNKFLRPSAIFHDNYSTDFNLIKYVKSMKDMSEGDNEFKDKTKTAYLFTNRHVKLTNNRMILDKSVLENFVNSCSNSQMSHITLTTENSATDHDIIHFSPYTDKLNLPQDPNFLKFTDDPNIVEILSNQSIVLSQDVGKETDKKTFIAVPNGPTSVHSPSVVASEVNVKRVDLKNITEDNIKKALMNIIYAVGQPNCSSLQKIIEDKLKEHFIMNDNRANELYMLIKNKMQEWCMYKNRRKIFDDQSDQHIIDVSVRNSYFQENTVKPDLSAEQPIKNFVGRKTVLKRIKNTLTSGDPKWLLITGLAGIGKTELVKKFIEDHPVYKTRVIWINAESPEEIHKAFECYCKKFNQRVCRHPLDNIDTVFEYVRGVEVLFVFDNFIKTKESMEYILHIKNYDPSYHQSPQKAQRRVAEVGKPISNLSYHQNCIFTSRNPQCLDLKRTDSSKNQRIKIEHEKINLNTLTLENACELINEELTTVNYKPDKNIVSELATTLLCIPKSLKEATNFIKNKQNENGVNTGECEIQSYLESSEPLNHLMPLWTATVDTMRINEQRNASKVLKYMLELKYEEKLEKIQLKKLREKFEDESELLDSILLLKNYHVLSDAGNQADIHEYKINNLAIKCGRQLTKF